MRTYEFGDVRKGPDATPRTLGVLSLSESAVVDLPLRTVNDSTLELPLVRELIAWAMR